MVTPVNSALQRIVRDMAAAGTRPGTVPLTVYEDLCRKSETAAPAS